MPARKVDAIHEARRHEQPRRLWVFEDHFSKSRHRQHLGCSRTAAILDVDRLHGGPLIYYQLAESES
jgi:hypothetical protein